MTIQNLGLGLWKITVARKRAASKKKGEQSFSFRFMVKREYLDDVELDTLYRKEFSIKRLEEVDIPILDRGCDELQDFTGIVGLTPILLSIFTYRAISQSIIRKFTHS